MSDDPLQPSGADAGGMTRQELLRRGVGAAAAVTLGSGLPAAFAAVPKRPVLRHGGQFRIATGGGATGATANLFLTSNPADRQRDRLVYEPLGAPTLDGSDVMGVLAESAVPNADATVWTIHLRKGIKFSDGTPFDSSAVLYTYKTAIADPLINAHFSLSSLNSAQITAPDAYTVQFVFPSSFPEALQQVLYSGSPYIIRAGDTSYANGTIGTGPFIVTTDNLGQSALLARNPQYWGAGKLNLPYFDTVEILSVADANARISALRQGLVDYAAGLPTASAKLNSRSSKVNLHRANPTGSLFHAFFLNTRVKPFDDSRVRLAFKLACNRQQIISNATDGFGSVANDVFGVGYVDSAKLPQRQYDPTQAKALLKQAGATGLSVPITCLSDFVGSTETATVYAQQLQAVGINATIDSRPTAQVLATNIAKSVQADMVSCLPIQDFDWPLAASIYLLPTALRDFTGWASPRWVAEFQKARATVAVAPRRKLDAALQKALWADGGFIAPSLTPTINAVAPDVVGVEDYGIGYALYANLTTARFTK